MHAHGFVSGHTVSPSFAVSSILAVPQGNKSSKVRISNLHFDDECSE